MRKTLVQDLLIGLATGLFGFALVTGKLFQLLPLFVLAAAVAVILFAGGVPGFTPRQRIGITVENHTGVSFEDIGGQEAAKRELLEALQFLRDPSEPRRLGIRPLRGILLAGPPGTGKTLLAKAAAAYTGSAFLAASGSEFVEVYAGVGAQRIRSLFRRAREAARKAPNKSAVVFIDEIEVIGGRRGRHTSHLEYDQTLNQLLVEMDGLATGADGLVVVVIGATNRIDLIDEALLRPGRFDRIVQVQMPDREGRLQILRVHVQGKPLAADVDLEALARETFGFSGAHLESLVNEAAILAWRQQASRIHQRHFEEALEKVLLGERGGRKPTAEEKRRVAVHEAGHALVSELLRPGSVAAVTIVPRGGTLGYVRRRPEEDESLMTREQLEMAAQVALGGYVAEQLVFGTTSTGAVGDLNQFSSIIDQMIAAGMSELGPVAPDRIPPDQAYRTAAKMAEAFQQRVYALLEAHRNTLESLSQLLLSKETLTAEEVRALIHGPAGIASEAGESPSP